MKIYASRKQLSDRELLDSLLGADKWVKVTDTDTNQPLYIRVVALGTDAATQTEPWYSYNAVGADFVEKYQNHLSTYGVKRVLTVVYRGPAASFAVHYPLEILSTGDLTDIIKSDDPDQITGEDYL